jgi:hypothetical protein
MVEKEVRDNSFGIISFVFGVLSILIVFLTLLAILAPAVGLVLSILGLIFGIVQVKKGKTGLAVWGIVLSAIGLIVNGLIVIKAVSIISNFLQQCRAAGGCDKLIQQLAQSQAQAQASNLAGQYGLSGSELPSFPA